MAIRGGFSDISLSFALAFLPLLILSAALLVVVFLYQVDQHGPSPRLAGAVDQLESGVYYVRISSATFVLIASYCSTVAPLLVGGFMSLISYLVANSILRNSQLRKLQGLPTAFQLGLIITLLKGGAGALWDWVKYTAGWKRRNRLPSSVRIPVSAVFIMTIFTYTSSFGLII
jgi:hypothetical protein